MKKMTTLRSLLLVIALVSASWLHAAQRPEVTKPQVEAPKRILFVGNSYFYYNNSLHNYVLRIAVAADPANAGSLQYRSETINTASLAYHNIRHLLEPGRLGVKSPFDVVILAGNSTDALSNATRASFREKVKEFSAEIAKRGGKTALYMTHAHVKPSKFASPDMMRRIEEMYVSVGNEVGALVIPVGLAFEEAYRQRPDIRLHQDYDGSHPDLLGTYLAACVVYASLYGKSPVGNSYDYYGRVDRESASFLQKVADDTVRRFFGR
jgi:hypothetical protein